MTPKYEIIPFINSDGKRIQAIEIQGEYPGIVYSYNNAELVEVPTEDNALLNFDYTLHEGELLADEKVLFHKVIGDILVDIITNGIMPNME